MKAIALCGAPLSGKTELLRQVHERLGGEYRRRQTPDTHVISELVLEANEITLRTVTGVEFYWPKATREVLEPAVHVIYVTSADPGDGERQRRFWSEHTPIVESMTKSWRDIPWLVVLNKTDLGTQNPLEPVLPAGLRPHILAGAVHVGRGVEDILARLELR